MILSELIKILVDAKIILTLENDFLSVNAPKGAVTPEIMSALKEHKSNLINYLRESTKVNKKIVSIDRGQTLELSYAQQRLWLLNQIDSDNANHNMPAAFKLFGNLNTEVLNQSFTTIIERHESLRTCFVAGDNGQPLQVIQPVTPFIARITDLSGLEDEARQLQIRECVTKEFGRTFDLRFDLMLRAQLIKITEDEHIVLVTMHHIASDGWSLAVLINEFSTLYSAYIKGQKNPLPPLPIQYADYAHWQRNWLQREVLDKQIDYWATQLAGLPVVHSLPLDYARPQIQTFAGSTINSYIAAEPYKALNTICSAQGATLFMGLHAAFSVLLSRYSNETDIVIGSFIANREQSEVADLIGFFVNSLVLRNDLSGDPSFNALLKQSKSILLDAYAHQQVPFEQIVERLQPERSLSHSALFQVMLILQNNEQGALELPNLTLSPTEKPALGISEFDLTLEITENEQGLTLAWKYNTDLFEKETIVRMSNHFGSLLKALVLEPDKSVFSVEMLSAQERQQLLIDWNDTQADYPKEKCIHELFEVQAETNETAIAVVFEDQKLTYGELNRKANQLAHYLINKRQVKPDTLVGICVERSLEMIISILAILKAGAAYVPLDPAYPEARLKYMLHDAKLATVLTQSHLSEITPVTKEQAICLDSEIIQQQLHTQSTQNITAAQTGLRPNHLAYVIYTSGSTGNPKGVMVEHQALVNLATSIKNLYCLSSEDRFLQFATINFDMSIEDIFASLSAGCALVLRTDLWLQSPDIFWQYCASTGVSVLDLPTAFWHLLAYDENTIPPTCIRHISIGGEQVNALAIKKWYQKNARVPVLLNTYGPTECTVDSSTALIVDDVNTIGKALPNYNFFILNHNQSLTPQGVAGELHIGGLGLARGYLNRPDLTAEKFIRNPFYDNTNPASSERLYKTGDLVRWLPNGELEFLGRIDHQVKIRGFRIELGEIESTLSAHAAVTEAIVLAKESAVGDKRLVAYVVTPIDLESEIETAITARHELIEDLRRYVGQTLPDYMLPSAFVLLEQLPLTLNGKVDRKSLPEPDVSAQQYTYVEPRTETEKILCEIWQDVLGIERVGATDNFFQLGGHSLLVMQIISRVQQKNLAMTVRQLFLTPTVIDLAKVLDAGRIHTEFKAPANLIPDKCELITPDMLPLVVLSEKEIAHIMDKIPGGASNVQDIYPLGPLQEGILFHHIMSTQGDTYAMPSLFKISSRKAVIDFIEALQFIINRHDIMRSAVFWEGLSIPVQVVCREATLPVFWLEQDTNQSDAVQSLEMQMLSLFAPDQQWIDLGQAPLVRLQIAVDPQSGQHFVLLQNHHIIADHIGVEIIKNELAIYLAGRGDSLPVTIPYREFIAHIQHQALNNDAVTFFSNMLGEIEEPTTPFGLVDTNGDGSRICETKADIPANIAVQIRSLAKVLKVSPAALFHTAWAMVIASCSGRDDVVFGTVVSGRLQGTIGAEHMLGVFINTLPLRVNLQNCEVIDAVHQVHHSLLNLLPYEQTSLAFAQRCSGLPIGAPLFTALFNYRHEKVVIDLANHEDFKLVAAQERTNYPFNISVDDFGDGFGLEVQVDQSVDAKRIATYMQTAVAELVEALTVAPHSAINSLSILSVEERQQLLVEWNNTQSDYPHNKCVHELFEAQVQHNPDSIAVIFNNEQLTYDALNKKANQLAHYLIAEKKVTPDTLVGICVDRSFDMVVGILAIMKAGGAYVPLDPEYPEARLKYLLDDSQLSTVLIQRHLRETTPVTDLQAVCLDSVELNEYLHTQPTTNPDPTALGLTSDHLAYVIYTSGSTGNPKGSLLTHSSLCNLALAQIEGFRITPESRVLQFASIAFDAATSELCTALLQGAALVLLNTETTQSPEVLSAVVETSGVTHATVPPVLLPLLTIAHWKKVTTLVVAGDACSESMAREWSRDRLFINAYGPSETTVCATMGVFDESQSVLHIGKPISNTQAYVLNEQHALLPQGIAGELHIGGVGLARGYLNRGDLTAEKFIRNPFYDNTNPASSERLYKTGDLVRWLPDGNLEFLGRIDHQVKIRGFRIELGEIENTLIAHADVKDAIVLATVSPTGGKRLVAYVIADAIHSEENLQEEGESVVVTQYELMERLRHHVKQCLPDYMVPAVFVLLQEFPLTLNGKVDRKALPEPDLSTQQNIYVAPTTDTEKVLCEIWQEVLGVERVGVTDNFFQLGGHSISLIKLLTMIKELLNKEIKIRDFFELQTLQLLAEKIDTQDIVSSESDIAFKQVTTRSMEQTEELIL